MIVLEELEKLSDLLLAEAAGVVAVVNVARGRANQNQLPEHTGP